MTRDSLFKSIREDLQRAEDALGVLGEHFDQPALPRLGVETLGTPGDIFRRLTVESRDMPACIRALLVTDKLLFPRDAGNAAAEGIARFATLDHKMLRRELDSAHAAFWAYVKQFTDEDLAQTFTIHEEEQTLGKVILSLVRHEVEHANEALAAAGGRPKRLEYYPYFYGRFSLRRKNRTSSHRHPDFEMLEWADDDRRDARHFATLVYISGEWALNLDGRRGSSLATYPTLGEAWEAARRDYVRTACEYCKRTGYRRPRRRHNGWSPRPYWMCAPCYQTKERKQDALLRRANSERFLRGAKWEAREIAVVAAQAEIQTAIEAAEAASTHWVREEYFTVASAEISHNEETPGHLKQALPHIKAATLPNSPHRWE